MKIPPFNDLVRLAQLNQDILLKEDREQELAEFFQYFD